MKKIVCLFKGHNYSHIEMINPMPERLFNPHTGKWEVMSWLFYGHQKTCERCGHITDAEKGELPELLPLES